VVIYRNGAADLELVLDEADEAAAEGFRPDPHRDGAGCEPSRSSSTRPPRPRAERRHLLDPRHRPPVYSWPGLDEPGASIAKRSACDAVVGNDEEFAILADAGSHGLEAQSAVDQGARSSSSRWGIAGSVTLFSGGRFETGVIPVKAKKPFGAGDAFLGGVVAGLVGGISLEQAVRRGTAAAAIVVSRRGCASAMPGTKDIDAMLAKSGQEG
jgi:5-dehydro-2-deoxygluconokinase